MSLSASFLIPLAISVGAWFLIAVAGGLLTEIGAWYYNLRKPSWQPPDWAFGPIWTVILTLVAIASALAWTAAPVGAGRSILTVLIINGLLHMAWSGLFFKLRRPDWSLVEVAILWLSIISLIIVLGRYSALAGWMLVPYLAWVSTAAFLNWQVVQLNGPFGGQRP